MANMLALRKPDNWSTIDVATQGGEFVGAFEDLKNALRRGMVVATSVLVLAFVLFIVVVPVGYIFGLWFSRQRAFLIRTMRKDPMYFKTPNQYVQFKKHVERLYKRNGVLREVCNLDLKKVPIIVRFPVKKMKYLSSTLLTYQEWLNSRLTIYNQEQFKSEEKFFSFKSESELWNSRNKEYAYWM